MTAKATHFKRRATAAAAWFGLSGCMLGAPAAFGAILSDNLANMPGGVESASTTRWLAASFATDGSAHTLGVVALSLANPVSGAAEVRVYSNGGFEPGAQVGVLASPPSFSSTLSATVFSGNIVLAANTTYWVVLAPQSGQFDWAWTADNSGNGAGFQHVWGVSEDAGAFWWTQDTYPTQFSIAVDVCSGPSISQEPSAASGAVGGSASFTIAVAGTAPLVVQWRHNGAALSDGSGISGANSSTLSLTNLTCASAGSYDAVVTNMCGSASSAVVELTVSACVLGDMNCDGVVNNFDIDPFVLAIIDPLGYAAQYPACNILNGDVSGDGLFNNFDIDPFIALLVN